MVTSMWASGAMVLPFVLRFSSACNLNYIIKVSISILSLIYSLVSFWCQLISIYLSQVLYKCLSLGSIKHLHLWSVSSLLSGFQSCLSKLFTLSYNHGVGIALPKCSGLGWEMFILQTKCADSVIGAGVYIKCLQVNLIKLQVFFVFRSRLSDFLLILKIWVQVSATLWKW